MRVISKSHLRRFWSSPNCQDAEMPLTAWYQTVKAATWQNFGDVRGTLGSTDMVGNCLVFDIGNNRYRLIGRANYHKQIMYVLRIMTHKEYSKDKWPQQCGCHDPPPPPRLRPTRLKPKKQKRR